MRRRYHISLRLLLSGLLVSGGFSLGIRHAHPGGERAHHHRGPAASQSLDCERATIPHRHAAHHAHDHEALASAPLHRHVFILGFEFTLTESDQSPVDSHDTIPVAGKDMLVRLVSGELANAPSTAFSAAVSGDAATCALSVAHRVDWPTVSDGCMAATSRPLCDTARHERSGVQLM